MAEFYSNYEFLDWYWGIGESFELSEHMDNKELTNQAARYLIDHGVTEGMCGTITQDGQVYIDEPVTDDETLSFLDNWKDYEPVS